MELIERHAGKALVLGTSGRIDHATAEGFRMALQPHLEQCKTGTCVIVLDFSAVEYISSVGLRVLMLAAKQVKSQGGAIGVASLQPVVQEIFEISKFNLVIPCFAAVGDALAAFTPPALASNGAA
jgi:anti-anti-sigma factor